MNLFAHAVLAAQNATHQAAGILADRLKGVPGQEPFSLLPSAVQAGVIQHRAIDSFTDQHPLQEGMRGLFSPRSRRVAGIVLDLYGDQRLCAHWGRYNSRPKEQCREEAYSSLRSIGPSLPAPAAKWAASICRYDLLTACCRWEGVYETALRLGARIGQQEAFLYAMRELATHREAIDKAYAQFLDDLFARFRVESPCSP